LPFLDCPACSTSRCTSTDDVSVKLAGPSPSPSKMASTAAPASTVAATTAATNAAKSKEQKEEVDLLDEVLPTALIRRAPRPPCPPSVSALTRLSTFSSAVIDRRTTSSRSSSRRVGITARCSSFRDAQQRRGAGRSAHPSLPPSAVVCVRVQTGRLEGRAQRMRRCGATTGMTMTSMTSSSLSSEPKSNRHRVTIHPSASATTPHTVFPACTSHSLLPLLVAAPLQR
jgi:hypothetical protein